ncbi:hypothetical protein WJX79_010138 [Trebouxia sp. C0005]
MHRQKRVIRKKLGAYSNTRRKVLVATSQQQQPERPEVSQNRVVMLLSNSSEYLPYAVVASAAAALLQPVSFAWFTPSLYAPGLGFLMFAVGVNLQLKAFAKVFKTQSDAVYLQLLLLGVVGQWIVKPLLGITMASTLVPALNLPSEVATGLVLVSCVSGAQLSNYATFLIVILPVGIGLVCSTFLPSFVKRLRPLLAPLSLLDTCACVGASLASNAAAARSSMGATVLLPAL